MDSTSDPLPDTKALCVYCFDTLLAALNKKEVPKYPSD